MSAGIWATVEFDEPDICPLVHLSSTAETKIDGVTQNVAPPDCEVSITEFSIKLDAVDSVDDLDGAVVPLLTAGEVRRYRLVRRPGIDCPCECLGGCGSSINRYTAEDGRLKLEFCTRDFEELQATIARLRDQFPSLDLRRLLRSPSDTDVEEIVQIDRAVLSNRQQEVLRLAFERGYFDRPRRTSVEEIASSLDLHSSTVSEHLGLAERKLIEQFF